MIKLPKKAHIKYTTKARRGFVLDDELKLKNHSNEINLHTWDLDGEPCTNAIESSIANYHVLDRLLSLHQVTADGEYYAFTEEDLETYIDLDSGNTLDNVVKLGDTYIRKYVDGYKIMYGLGTMLQLDDVKVHKMVGELVYCSLGDNLVCTRLEEGTVIDGFIPNSKGLPITLEDLEEKL